MDNSYDYCMDFNGLLGEKWWKKDFLYFKKMHGAQKYKDNLPYWHHLYLVASVLEFGILQFNEVSEDIRKAMIISALGHDSIEDTKLTLNEIKVRYGSKVSDFIYRLTNEKGDHDTKDYEDKIIEAQEEVKLIKMSDSIDNYTRQAYRVADNGPNWLLENILPIMEGMYQKLIKVEFDKYPQTGNFLKRRLIEAHNLSLTAIRISRWKDNTN